IEDIPESAEIGAEASPVETPCPAVGSLRGAGKGIVTHVVVLGTLLRVREYAVRLVDLLEFLLCARILADIRVILPGQVAVGFLYLLLVRIPGNAQDIVVITRGHRAHSSFTL